MLGEFKVWIYDALKDKRETVYQGFDWEVAEEKFKRLHADLENSERYRYGIDKRTVTPFVSVAHTLL
jgi:hypothetical protein